MQTDYRLGAKVESQNGEYLGDLKHLVMGQDGKQVSQLVVGNDKGLRTVNLDNVAGLNQAKDTLRLNLNSDQFNQLPRFDEKKFAAERGYPAGGKQQEEARDWVAGGYSANPDSNMNPPGVVDNNSSQARQ